MGEPSTERAAEPLGDEAGGDTIRQAADRRRPRHALSRYGVRLTVLAVVLAVEVRFDTGVRGPGSAPPG